MDMSLASTDTTTGKYLPALREINANSTVPGIS
jgi:hypothetical protein